jgi:hypothetical protein
MAKTAASPSPASTFRLPELKLPAFDLDTLFSVQKANLAAAQEIQTVLADAAQAIARVQHGYLEASVAAVRTALGRKELAKPEAVLGEFKAAAEQTITAAKQVVDLAVTAQRRVVELAAQRTKAHAGELKALAA